MIALKLLHDDGSRYSDDLLKKRDECCLAIRNEYLIGLTGELSAKLNVPETDIFYERIHVASLTCIASEIGSLTI